MRRPGTFAARRGDLLVVLVIAGVTAVLLPFRSVLSPAQVMLLYVPVIVWLARAFGVRASVAAAVVSFLAVDVLFVAPYYRLGVSSSVDWVTLVMFLGVAVAAGFQTGRMRQRERAAIQRQREIALLNRLSSRLVSEESTDAMASFIVHEVVSVLGADRAALFGRKPDGTAELLAQAGGPEVGVTERAFADWVIRNDRAVALPVSEDVPLELRPITVEADAAVSGAVADGAFVPLQTTDGLEGVLYARPLAGAEIHPGGTRQLLAVANLAAVFLERRRLEEAAAHTAAMQESDRLKATLVSSVSHELKTPLAAVTARITGLLGEHEGFNSERVRSELTAASEDLSRLDSSIGDLVDVSRLESDAWRPKPDLYELGEVLGTVAERIPTAQRGRVSFAIPEGLGLVRVDFNQVARAISNLVENALVYTPVDQPVMVGARELGGEMLVWVEDRGPGVPDDEKQQVFEKFYRGSTSGPSPAGTGLGLAIVREIVRSHGGRAWVEDASPSGARFVLSLPLGGPAR
jgi:two-component system sensor histidine kinase KdpD